MNVALLTLALAASAAEERIAVLGIADPPGPEPELVELTHQLRGASRERSPGVLDIAEMRARFLGQSSPVTLAELERAYGGAIATYQQGEYRTSLRTLRAIVEDLEKLPETRESYVHWIRANLRLAVVELTIGNERGYRELLERVAATDPRHQPDPDQFSPTFRRDFDAARARVASRAKRRLRVSTLGGWAAAVFVNGRDVGEAPRELVLPAGRYRVGATAGALRVPSVWVELGPGDVAVTLDFEVAEALRIHGGPALALASAARGPGIVRAGAWLAADRVVATSIASDGGAQFLVGSLYDVQRGALLREGRVRMLAGAVPSPSVAALAAFLLTGQPSRDVVNSTPQTPVAVAEPAAALAAPAATPGPTPLSTPSATPAPASRPATPTRTSDAAPTSTAISTSISTSTPTTTAATTAAAPSADPPLRSLGPPRGAPIDLSPRPQGALSAELVAASRQAAAARPRWVKPTIYASAALAGALGALAVQQGLSARSAYDRASGLVRPDGAFATEADLSRYRDATASGDAAKRNAWLAVGGSAAFAATAGVLGYLTWTADGSPAVRF
jgi:hypothetical protein